LNDRDFLEQVRAQDERILLPVDSGKKVVARQFLRQDARPDTPANPFPSCHEFQPSACGSSLSRLQSRC